MSLPAQFTWPFSQATPWLETFIQKKAKALPKSEALSLSKKAYKEILRCAQAIQKQHIPPHLHLAFVHPLVETGVFLKKGEKCIQKGELIGVYTGVYELVKADALYNTAYAYDVLQDIKLRKSSLSHVLIPPDPKEPITTAEEYSIQTNAQEAGNFTRFINHSSIDPNVEAIVCKLPENRIEIVLFARKKIRPGEQLLSCYGGQYWRALHIIPNNMRPTTYTINAKGKVQLTQAERNLSPKQKSFLEPLREPFPYFPEELDKLAWIKKWKKTLPHITQRHRKQIEELEEILSERGLPRYLALRFTKNNPLISLQKKEKMIRKGSVLGILCGLFSTSGTSSSSCRLLHEEGKYRLFLHCDKQTNFLHHLPYHPKGNVQLALYYDTETDSFYPLALASRDIHPGEILRYQNEKQKN